MSLAIGFSCPEWIIIECGSNNVVPTVNTRITSEALFKMQIPRPVTWTQEGLLCEVCAIYIKLPRWFLGATKLKCNLWPVPQEGQSEMRLICRKFICRLTSVEEWRKWGWANSHNKCFSGSLQTSSPNMEMGSNPVTPLTGLELDVCCYWKGGWPCWSPFSSAAGGRQLWE